MTFSAPVYNYANQSIALIGYGVTGKSCATFLLSKGAIITVFDTCFDTIFDQSTDQLVKPDDVKNDGLKPKNPTFFALNDSVDLSGFDLVVVSPGINLHQAFIARFINNAKQNKYVVGDIELFARELNSINCQIALNDASLQSKIKVIAVTGSNGKSTVVDMLTKVLNEQGINAVLGGNFGTCALSLISQYNNDYQHTENKNNNIDVIVLELSSFQLESTYSLRPDIACVLNVTSDHIDRHKTMAEYASAKQKIYMNAGNTIFNRDDQASYPMQQKEGLSFGLSKPKDCGKNVFYQTSQGIYQDSKRVLEASDFPNISQFNMLNMQVVLGCSYILHLDTQRTIESLSNYKALAHRFETIHQDAHTIWINDSKATNPGAAIAAIESLALHTKHIILIAGGDAKGADTHSLAEAIKKHVDLLILLGKDAELFTHFKVPFQHADSIEQAVELADKAAKGIINDDVNVAHSAPKGAHNSRTGILLSPACASIDMFKNYQQRGDLFCQAVVRLVAA